MSASVSQRQRNDNRSRTELPNSITEADVAKGIGQFYEQYAISPDLFARAVAFAISQPEDVDINEILSGRRARITEALTHLGFYAGWPKATKAMTAVTRILGK